MKLTKQKIPLTRRQYGIADIETLMGFNRLTARRRWKKGLFPVPQKIGGRLFWSAEILDAWILETLEVKHG